MSTEMKAQAAQVRQGDTVIITTPDAKEVMSEVVGVSKAKGRINIYLLNEQRVNLSPAEPVIIKGRA